MPTVENTMRDRPIRCTECAYKWTVPPNEAYTNVACPKCGVVIKLAISEREKAIRHSVGIY